jgi:diguanylate cyclase (GGDEF)-like protein
MDEHHGQTPPRQGRRPFVLRACIFIGLGAIAQASAALPPGPSNLALYWASLGIFVACAASVFLPAWERLPRWAILVPTMGYLVSVTLLLISGGTNPGVQSTAGGLSALVLLPVLAMALYYPSSYTAIVVGATVVSLTVVGIATQSSTATDLRRVVLWTAVAVVVAVTVHHLRRSLEGKVRDSAELARLGRLMNGATQSLTALRDPGEVIAEGTLAMSELAGSGFRGASYLRVSDGVVTQEAVVDDRSSVATSYLLKDDPYVKMVVDSGEPLITKVERTSMGATLRSVTDDMDITDVALIPVKVNDELHGMFQIDGEGTAMSEDVFGRCRALANVVELALGNALAHQELEMQANTDPLTGLANRRGLSLYLEGDRRLNAVGILVLDIDHLKMINDEYGHDIGDKILIAVARAASGVLRGGDLLARTGGDEFLAVVAGADEVIARRVADRVTEAVSRVKVQGVRTSVSVGFACGGKNSDIDRLRQQADEAMYEAKHVVRRQQARHPRVADRA